MSSRHCFETDRLYLPRAVLISITLPFESLVSELPKPYYWSALLEQWILRVDARRASAMADDAGNMSVGSGNSAVISKFPA